MAIGSRVPDEVPAGRADDHGGWWIFLVAGLLSLRAFGPTRHDGWTDTDILADFACAGEGAASLVQPLTCGRGGDNANFYRPLAMLQFWFLRAAFGPSPWAWHAWSLALHVATGTVLGRLVRRHAGLAAALGATALFAAHPLAVEIVPALARNLEIPFVLGFCAALLSVGTPWCWFWSMVTVASKEAGVLLLPVLAVYAPRRAPWFGLLSGVLAYFAARQSVLGGLGGYGTLADPRALAVAPVELVLPSLGSIAPPLAGAGAGWVLLVVAGLGVTVWVGSRTPARPLVLAMAATLASTIALYAVTGTYSRRLLYLPSAASSVLVAVAFARVFSTRNRPGLLVGGTWFAAWLHGSPAVLPYRDWVLSTSAMAPYLDPGWWAQLPDGGTAWLLDRPSRVDADPRRFRYWSTRRSLNNTVSTYSIAAWIEDRTGKKLQLRHASSMSTLGAPQPARLSLDAGVLRVQRPGADVTPATRSPFAVQVSEGGLVVTGEGTLWVYQPAGLVAFTLSPPDPTPG